jgi:cobalt-zinc-cadmium efflux system membrane fusion protein
MKEIYLKKAVISTVTFCLVAVSAGREPAAAQHRYRGGSHTSEQTKPPVKPALIVIPADSPQLLQLKTPPVEMTEVPRNEIVAPGRIGFDVGRVSRILLPTAGRISRVLVRLGDAVTAGQSLLEIDSPDADAAIAECRQAEALFKQSQSILNKALADYERNKDLWEHKAVAKKEVLAAENELAQARSGVEQADAALTHCRRRLDILGLRSGIAGQKLTVRATLTGKVIESAVAEGEFRSDTATPLMTIADLSVVWVTSEVPEQSIRFIEPGERVQVELVAFPGEVFDARVMRIADMVDPKTRTIQVQAELPNPQRRIRPEMFGRIRHSHAPHTQPVVPPEAIVHRADGSFLYIEHSKGTFERIRIQTGAPIAGGVPVLQNLHAGDRVVVSGSRLLAGLEKN